MQDDKNAMRFPQKLWYLLNLHTDAVMWGGTGRTILLNYRILHNYLQCDNSVFKTTNISSFVRQLNLYGFRKVTSHLQDPLCNSSNPYMHEYVHDYFLVGRPELLNKITRKALTLRRMNNMSKHRGTLFVNNGSNATQCQHGTPLQKARRALHIALRKAAQDLFILHSPSLPNCLNLKFEEGEEENNEDFCEDEDTVESDWMNPKMVDKENQPSQTESNESVQTSNVNSDTTVNAEATMEYGDTSADPDAFMSFNNMPCQPNTDGFSALFLSMPELEPQTADESEVELLAEFNIDRDMDQGVTMKIGDKNYQNSLNCVLPSITKDPIDDVSMEQTNPEDSDAYDDREWDQMFNDIIISHGPSSECGSDLKELYSQISRTIDLLNS